jgi:hypothetical protein
MATGVDDRAFARSPDLAARDRAGSKSAVVTEDLLQNAREQTSKYTAQTSTLVRTLGLAAIAMSWAFAGGFSSDLAGNKKTLEILQNTSDLRASLTWSVVALSADIVQYALGSAILATYYWYARALLDPASTSRLHWTQRLGLRLSKATGFFRFVERESGLPESGTWADRRKRLRDLAVRAQTGDSWPDGSHEARMLRVVKEPYSRAQRLVNLSFAAKVAALAVAYVYLLRYLL